MTVRSERPRGSSARVHAGIVSILNPSPADRAKTAESCPTGARRNAQANQPGEAGRKRNWRNTMEDRSDNLSDNWRPDSWQSKPAAQQPVYPDPAALHAVMAHLSKLPPLVTSWEIETLKRQLAEAAAGDRFLLQGGDCSESFDDCESGVITAKLKILLQMGIILIQGGKKRIIRVGRFAGQYAKPRSADNETKNGLTLPAYRGDMINRMEFEPGDRKPDPDLLLRGYERAGLTINFVRALIDGGFADLHHPEYWELGFVRNSPLADEYMHTVESIGESLSFMETMTGTTIAEINRVDFFTSHEGLHLLYEQAQTRQVPRRQGWYNLSTHFPWIGERTRALTGAHIEYFRGIQNPIGVKVGPSATPDDVLALCEVLNPSNEPGRLTLIHRFGAERVATCLPPIVEAVRRNNKAVLWCCDPMHGNTETTSNGIKTRRFEKILSELESSFRILHECGAHLGGVHFELTGDNVTECIGGASGVTEADLTRAYRTQVDPRLNYEQALEMAFLLAMLMAQTPSPARRRHPARRRPGRRLG
jgi:3-deoxy-7-phosphoheptulonate synthase